MITSSKLIYQDAHFAIQNTSATIVSVKIVKNWPTTIYSPCVSVVAWYMKLSTDADRGESRVVRYYDNNQH